MNTGGALKPLAIGWYRRRRPWIGAPPPVPVGGSVPRPWVIRSDFCRSGQVIRVRPPLHPPPPPVAGGIPPVRIVRPSLPRRLAEGRVSRPSWLSPPPGPIKPDRVFRLRAGANTIFARRAASETVFALRAAVKSSWNLQASETMSVPSNVRFFQGEDLQFLFALTPPTDITGWTLTGTVQNKLGGVTQFTFTPTITDSGRGWFSASWTRSQTSALTPGDYVWDIRRIDSGKNSVLAHGEATVKQPVTP